MKNTTSIIKYNIINNEKKSFKEQSIDENIFKKITTMELLNNIANGEKYNLNNAFMNSARILNGKDVPYKKFKYSKSSVLFDNLKTNKSKIGLTALIGMSALILGEKVKSYSEKNNGKYILGKNNSVISEKDLLEQLNFGNGMKDNNYLQNLLTDINTPKYIDILKKKYF